MPVKVGVLRLLRKTKVFLFDWRAVLLFLSFAVAFLMPFLAASGSSDASSEYLATLIAQEAATNTESLVLNVNYAPIPSDTPLTRTEVSSMCSDAHLDSTYKYVEMNYNARVVVNENIGDYVRVESFESQETSLVLSNVFSNHQNPLGETIFDIFELKLMFPKTNTGFSGYDNFCYIRQEDADYLIESSGGQYQDYEDLIDTVLPVTFLKEEEACEWKIANILYSDNDVYRHFDKVIGPWMLCYIYLPSFEGCAFNFDYGGSVRTNESYLDMYRNKFGGKNFTIAITTRDILDQSASNVSRIQNLMLGNGEQGYPSAIAISLSIASLIPSAALLFGFRKFVSRNTGASLSMVLVLAFCLYEGFSLAYLVSPLNVVYFTGLGMILFLITLILVIVFVMFARVFGGWEK